MTKYNEVKRFPSIEVKEKSFRLKYLVDHLITFYNEGARELKLEHDSGRFYLSLSTNLEGKEAIKFLIEGERNHLEKNNNSRIAIKKRIKDLETELNKNPDDEI